MKKKTPKPKRKPITPKEDKAIGEMIDRANRIQKYEAKAAKKMKEVEGYKKGGKVKKVRKKK